MYASGPWSYTKQTELSSEGIALLLHDLRGGGCHEGDDDGPWGSFLERLHLVDTALRTGPRFLDALGRKNVNTMKEVAVASVLVYEEGAIAGGLLAAYVTHNQWSKISYNNHHDHNHTGSLEESLKKSTHGVQQIKEGGGGRQKETATGRKETNLVASLPLAIHC